MAAVLEVANETTASTTRTIKDGRKITYQMNVVQQPERARACGQGAKSSTDRRPVDPPPILALRVFEGEGPNAVDITVSYKANFFVWASLEHARPIAQGRVSQGTQNTPVLCGTPVAGVSYLDRPKPAGYFIFPDLSVRHEGKYRINFTLYEDLKDPVFDDLEPQPCPVEGGLGTEFVYCRCEVKSVPFIVYSAKKFPGLAESTALSRMVADQGCRVRIRRDVRMRRRDNKGGKDWDDYEDATADQRARQASTPVHDLSKYPPPPPGSVHHSRAPSGEPQARPRSNSMSSSIASQHPAVHPTSNEWPQQDPGPAYQQMGSVSASMAPQPSPQFYRAPGTIESAPIPSYPPPHQYMTQPPMAQSPQPMHNPQMSPYQMNATSAWGYQPHPQMQSPSYGPPVNHIRHSSIPYGPAPQDYQAQPGPPQYASDGHSSAPLAPMDNEYHRHMHPQSQIYPNGQQTTVASPHNQAPFTTDLPPLRPRTSTGGFDRATPMGPTTSYGPQPGAYAAQPPPPQYISQVPAGAAAQKRSFGTVFSTQHIDQPLRAGARPDAAGGSNPITVGLDGNSDPSSSDDDSLDLERLKMEYRRADGTKVQRRWPSAA